MNEDLDFPSLNLSLSEEKPQSIETPVLPKTESVKNTPIKTFDFNTGFGNTSQTPLKITDWDKERSNVVDKISNKAIQISGQQDNFKVRPVYDLDPKYNGIDINPVIENSNAYEISKGEQTSWGQRVFNDVVVGGANFAGTFAAAFTPYYDFVKEGIIIPGKDSVTTAVADWVSEINKKYANSENRFDMENKDTWWGSFVPFYSSKGIGEIVKSVAYGLGAGAAFAAETALVTAATEGVGTIPLLATKLRSLYRLGDVTKDILSGTKTLASTIESSRQLYGSLSTSAKIVGGLELANEVRRDFIGAVGEAEFEANEVKDSIKNKFLDDYYKTYGTSPSNEELNKLNQLTEKAHDTRYALNVAMLMWSNKYLLKAFQKPFSDPIGLKQELLDRGLKFGLDEKLDFFTKSASKMTSDFFTRNAVTKGLGRGIEAFLSLRNKPITWSEGLEELYQYGIQKSTDNYFTSFLNGKNNEIVNNALLENIGGVLQDVYKNKGDLLSQEGVQSLLSGIFAGSGQNAVTNLFGDYKIRFNENELDDQGKPTGKKLPISVVNVGKEREVAFQKSLETLGDSVQKQLSTLASTLPSKIATRESLGASPEERRAALQSVSNLSKIKDMTVSEIDRETISTKTKFDTLFPEIQSGTADIALEILKKDLRAAQLEDASKYLGVRLESEEERTVVINELEHNFNEIKTSYENVKKVYGFPASTKEEAFYLNHIHRALTYHDFMAKNLSYRISDNQLNSSVFIQFQDVINAFEGDSRLLDQRLLNLTTQKEALINERNLLKENNQFNEIVKTKTEADLKKLESDIKDVEKLKEILSKTVKPESEIQKEIERELQSNRDLISFADSEIEANKKSIRSKNGRLGALARKRNKEQKLKNQFNVYSEYFKEVKKDKKLLENILERLTDTFANNNGSVVPGSLINKESSLNEILKHLKLRESYDTHIRVFDKFKDLNKSNLTKLFSEYLEEASLNSEVNQKYLDFINDNLKGKNKQSQELEEAKKSDSKPPVEKLTFEEFSKEQIDNIKNQIQAILFSQGLNVFENTVDDVYDVLEKQLIKRESTDFTEEEVVEIYNNLLNLDLKQRYESAIEEILNDLNSKIDTPFLKSEIELFENNGKINYNVAVIKGVNVVYDSVNSQVVFRDSTNLNADSKLKAKVIKLVLNESVTSTRYKISGKDKDTRSYNVKESNGRYIATNDDKVTFNFDEEIPTVEREIEEEPVILEYPDYDDFESPFKNTDLESDGEIGSIESKTSAVINNIAYTAILNDDGTYTLDAKTEEELNEDKLKAKKQKLNNDNEDSVNTSKYKSSVDNLIDSLEKFESGNEEDFGFYEKSLAQGESDTTADDVKYVEQGLVINNTAKQYALIDKKNGSILAHIYRKDKYRIRIEGLNFIKQFEKSQDKNLSDFAINIQKAAQQTDGYLTLYDLFTLANGDKQTEEIALKVYLGEREFNKLKNNEKKPNLVSEKFKSFHKNIIQIQKQNDKFLNGKLNIKAFKKLFNLKQIHFNYKPTSQEIPLLDIRSPKIILNGKAYSTIIKFGEEYFHKENDRFVPLDTKETKELRKLLGFNKNGEKSNLKIQESGRFVVSKIQTYNGEAYSLVYMFQNDNVKTEGVEDFKKIYNQIINDYFDKVDGKYKRNEKENYRETLDGFNKRFPIYIENFPQLIGNNIVVKDTNVLKAVGWSNTPWYKNSTNTLEMYITYSGGNNTPGFKVGDKIKITFYEKTNEFKVSKLEGSKGEVVEIPLDNKVILIDVNKLKTTDFHVKEKAKNNGILVEPKESISSSSIVPGTEITQTEEEVDNQFEEQDNNQTLTSNNDLDSIVADIERRRQETSNKNEKFWEQITTINAEEVADRDNLINKLIKDIQLPANTRINNWLLEELIDGKWVGKKITNQEEYFGKENWNKIKEAKKQFDIEFKKIENSNLAKIALIEQNQSDLLNTIDGLELRKAWSFGLIEEPNIVGLDDTNFISKETEFKNGDLVETDNYEGYYYLSKPDKDGDWYEVIKGKTIQEVKDKINAKYDAELIKAYRAEEQKEQESSSNTTELTEDDKLKNLLVNVSLTNFDEIQKIRKLQLNTKAFLDYQKLLEQTIKEVIETNDNSKLQKLFGAKYIKELRSIRQVINSTPSTRGIEKIENINQTVQDLIKNCHQ